ncbi:THO complex subunit 2 [Dorcoceras hygrometricum]|uniref:THO complex subunit 2 n=1 Tax=Dorcoceras hygrometricum TaxID=472368 RepID=A0A2Z7BTJ9_9LAMI|nr:THO complex subunit 2 [Dorcoceras hygrometricum]
MGCPGQARTKPRRKNQPSQQSVGNHVGRRPHVGRLRHHAARAKRGRSRNQVARRTCIAVRCMAHSRAITAHSRALLFDHHTAISARPRDIGRASCTAIARLHALSREGVRAAACGGGRQAKIFFVFVIKISRSDAIWHKMHLRIRALALIALFGMVADPDPTSRGAAENKN